MRPCLLNSIENSLEYFTSGTFSSLVVISVFSFSCIINVFRVKTIMLNVGKIFITLPVSEDLFLWKILLWFHAQKLVKAFMWSFFLMNVFFSMFILSQTISNFFDFPVSNCPQFYFSRLQVSHTTYLQFCNVLMLIASMQFSQLFNQFPYVFWLKYWCFFFAWLATFVINYGLEL